MHSGAGIHTDYRSNSHTYACARSTNTERTTADGAVFQNTALGITAQTGTGADTVIREPDGTPVAVRVGGSSYYLVADAQGSTIALVDATGAQKNRYSYDPYGSSRAKTEAIANSYQYTGGYTDAATGLVKLGARYYDPTTARFTQPDPSGKETNAYAYARSCPSTFDDPTGLSFWSGLSTAAGYVGSCLAAGTIVGSYATLLAPEAAPAAFTVGFLTGCADGGLSNYVLGCNLLQDPQQ